MESDRSALWDAYLSSRDLGVRNRLVESYQPLAVSIAKGFKARAVSAGGSASLELDDLVGIAQEGMIRAVETYDPGQRRPLRGLRPSPGPPATGGPWRLPTPDSTQVTPAGRQELTLVRLVVISSGAISLAQ